MWIGKEYPTQEVRWLVDGHGQFIADISLPRQAELVRLPSPHAHARIKSIDVSQAAKGPGVLAVITGDELTGAIKPIPDASPMLRPGPTGGETKLKTFYPLATDKVYYVGQPVVAVVAEDRYLAEDALEYIKVEYEPLPAVVDAEKAMSPDAPLLFEEWGDNINFHQKWELGDAEKALKESPQRFQHRFYMHRCSMPPLEGRGSVADYNPSRRLLTVWDNNQRCTIAAAILAAILGLPANRVRVIAPQDIGGAFGSKAAGFGNVALVCYAAMKLGRPVRWIQDRMEVHIGGLQERDQVIYLDMGFESDGKATAMKMKLIGNQGSTLADIYQTLATLLGAVMPIPYDIPNLEIEAFGVATNKAVPCVNRSPGRMPQTFAVEKMMDIVARKLNMDPAEIRFKNFMTDFPWTSPAGLPMFDLDYVAGLRTLLDGMGYEKVKEEVAEMKGQGRHVGLGLAYQADIGSPFDCVAGEVFYNQPYSHAAAVRVEFDGSVTVLTGDSAQGQCRSTIIAQVVADEFGINPDDIVVHFGDSIHGVLAQHASNAQVPAMLSARKLKAKMAKIAAHMLELDAKEDEFEFRDGRAVWKKDASKSLSIAEIADVAWVKAHQLPEGMVTGLHEATVWESPRMWHPGSSGLACLVEVFPDTGEFKALKFWHVGDYGKTFNPMVVEGGTHGGIAGGFSNAFLEEWVYNEEGQPLTGTMLDYPMVTAMEMPPNIETFECNVPSSTIPLKGKRFVTEAAPALVGPALANAIEDALSQYRVTITELPLKPDRIRDLFAQADKA